MMFRLFLIFTFFLYSCESKCGLTNEENASLEEVTFLTDGKALFTQNCASCHHPLKEGTGPPFKDIRQRHNIDWVYNYVTNKKNRNESDCVEHKYDNELECAEFTYLKKEEVEAIFNFVVPCNLPAR